MHRFIPDPQAPTTPLDPTHTAAIKRWTRELLGLDENAEISVTELSCVDPGCPLVETSVAVFDAAGQTRQWKFTRPKVAATKLMLQQTFQQNR